MCHALVTGGGRGSGTHALELRFCRSDGPTPMLHPEASLCTDCGTEKLASAEAVLSTYIQCILDTWRGGLADEISNLVVSTVSGEDIREMVWHPHGRINSGLMARAWTDARGQAALEFGTRL